jgi:hypothetical protein
MTGGGSFRAEVAAESAFERLGGAGGYYRIGIEKIRVRTPRAGVKAGAARQCNAGPRHLRRAHLRDRDWAARLATAIDGPVIATDIDGELRAIYRRIRGRRGCVCWSRRSHCAQPGGDLHLRGERPQRKEDYLRTGAARVSRRRCPSVLDE